MKKTLIEKIPFPIPEEIERLSERAKIYDSSCSPEARVYFIDKDGGYYLKTAPVGALRSEADMSRYFHSKGLCPLTLHYSSLEGRDWLMTEKAVGEDCTHKIYLDDPKRLASLLGERLRALHETDGSDCPVQNRNDIYLALAHENYRKGQYDLSFFLGSASSPEAVFALLWENRERLDGGVLLHGDYCLPNIILDRWRFSSFIDVGNGGIGDRHIDLYWGAWTLNFNLKTNIYRDRFLDAYGRDAVDEEKLILISAAEVFG